MTPHLSEDLISQWIDRELDSRQSELVEEHLKDCESCRALESEMSEADRLFRAMEPVEPPPYLWTRIAAHLEAATREETHKSLIPPLRPAWLRASLLAPAALLLLTIVSTIAYVGHRVAARTQLAAIAEIDRAHSALLVLNTKNYNPFHVPTEVDAGANPFASASLRDEPNPFRTSPHRP